MLLRVVSLLMMLLAAMTNAMMNMDGFWERQLK